MRNPVHLVCFFRYIRFYPDGRLVYRTSPEPVIKVAKTLHISHALNCSTDSAHTKSKTTGGIVQYIGRYKYKGSAVFTAVRYDNSTKTEIRCRMKLRSTVRGANNRLDISSIVSYDREDGSSTPMTMGGDDNEDEVVVDDGVERRTYSRGMSPYVFVPFEQVQSSVLNLPVSQMDVYIPG